MESINWILIIVSSIALIPLYLWMKHCDKKMAEECDELMAETDRLLAETLKLAKTWK